MVIQTQVNVTQAQLNERKATTLGIRTSGTVVGTRGANLIVRFESLRGGSFKELDLSPGDVTLINPTQKAQQQIQSGIQAATSARAEEVLNKQGLTQSVSSTGKVTIQQQQTTTQKEREAQVLASQGLMKVERPGFQPKFVPIEQKITSRRIQGAAEPPRISPKPQLVRYKDEKVYPAPTIKPYEIFQTSTEPPPGFVADITRPGRQIPVGQLPKTLGPLYETDIITGERILFSPELNKEPDFLGTKEYGVTPEGGLKTILIPNQQGQLFAPKTRPNILQSLASGIYSPDQFSRFPLDVAALTITAGAASAVLGIAEVGKGVLTGTPEQRLGTLGSIAIAPVLFPIQTAETLYSQGLVAGSLFTLGQVGVFAPLGKVSSGLGKRTAPFVERIRTRPLGPQDINLGLSTEPIKGVPKFAVKPPKVAEPKVTAQLGTVKSRVLVQEPGSGSVLSILGQGEVRFRAKGYKATVEQFKIRTNILSTTKNEDFSQIGLVGRSVISPKNKNLPVSQLKFTALEDFTQNQLKINVVKGLTGGKRPVEVAGVLTAKRIAQTETGKRTSIYSVSSGSAVSRLLGSTKAPKQFTIAAGAGKFTIPKETTPKNALVSKGKASTVVQKTAKTSGILEAGQLGIVSQGIYADLIAKQLGQTTTRNVFLVTQAKQAPLTPIIKQQSNPITALFAPQTKTQIKQQQQFLFNPPKVRQQPILGTQQDYFTRQIVIQQEGPIVIQKQPQPTKPKSGSGQTTAQLQQTQQQQNLQEVLLPQFEVPVTAPPFFFGIVPPGAPPRRGLGVGAEEENKRRKKKKRRVNIFAPQPLYKPQVAAILLGITAKRPPKGRTGLEFRPIISNKPLKGGFFQFPQPKVIARRRRKR